MALEYLKIGLFVSILISLQSCNEYQESCVCDIEYKSYRWENLPIHVFSNDVDYDLMSNAIDTFNESIGFEAFIVETDEANLAKFVYVFYADLPIMINGKSGVLVDKNRFVDYAPIQINYTLPDERVEGILIHELGHALGFVGHQESGVMYCYNDGVKYNSKDEWYASFELLREWAFEIYGFNNDNYVNESENNS